MQIFGDLFKNLYASNFGGVNAEANPMQFTDTQASNLMSYDVTPGNFPTVGAQLGNGFNQMSKTFAQYQPMLNFGFNAASGIANTWNQYNQNKAMKEMLNFQKQKYANDLATTRKMTNMELSDRQARRVSANPNAESVDSYMKKWGV